MSYPEIPVIKNNPTLDGMYKFVQNVVYSTATEKELTLDMILPWNADQPAIEKAKLPLIVFVQGSAWTTPDRFFELPQLCELARKGYVVATCGHRSAVEGARIPSFLKDVKCAIRFLRKNADQYNIDPERVMIFGTSSGGNTSLLVGLTGDDPQFETEENAGYSDAVKAVVECFGPADLRMTFHYDPERVVDENTPGSDLVLGMFGKDFKTWGEQMDYISPVNYVQEGKIYPPFLLLHGTADRVVSYDETVKIYHKMLDCGINAKAYAIEGADHEGDFWSRELWTIITDYIAEVL